MPRSRGVSRLTFPGKFLVLALGQFDCLELKQ